MTASESGGETMGVAVPPLQLGATRKPTTPLVPTEGTSVTTSVLANSPPRALRSTTPTVPKEENPTNITQMASVVTTTSMPTESSTLAGDLTPSTLDAASQISEHSVAPVADSRGVPTAATERIATGNVTEDLTALAPETAPSFSTTEVPVTASGNFASEAPPTSPPGVSDTTLSAIEVNNQTAVSEEVVLSTIIPEMSDSIVAVATTARTADTTESTITMTTFATSVSSTEAPGVQNDSLAMPRVSTPTPGENSSTLPSSVVVPQSRGIALSDNSPNTTKSPEVVESTAQNLTYPKEVRPGMPGHLLLGPAILPDWRLYLILVSAIALAIIVILLIGWILTCICLRRKYQRKTKKLLLSSVGRMPSFRNMDSGRQYPLTAWPTDAHSAGSGEDSVQHFVGDAKPPKGTPSVSRTGGYASVQKNKHGESGSYVANAHTTSTPIMQRQNNQSEQGWQPPLSGQAPQDQQNQSYHTLSSFQPAGGGGSAWSDYDLSLGRRGLRAAAAEEGGPVASSLRMHPNVHRGLLAEMNAGVRLHPVAPQPPNHI
ncbi:hypothetical protein SprV_0802614800 [Sparganum proliferum]